MTVEELFPNGPYDGACGRCGCYVSADQQERHVDWHNDIEVAP